MLDLLLQRGEDLALWQDADIAYVVVDEFHTYDGAQGTDVAMLLRRLAAATNHSEPGRPLGKICPVATSATLGEGGNERTHPGGRRAGLRHRVRRELGDHRAAAAGRGVPRPGRLLAAAPGAAGTRGARRPACGRPGDGGDRQARHRPGDHRPGRTRAGAADVTSSPTRCWTCSATGRPRPARCWTCCPQGSPTTGAGVPGASPERTAAALARFVALLSVARNPDDGSCRSCTSRRTCGSGRSAGCSESSARTRGSAGSGRRAPETESTTRRRARESLPAVYCRHCGRSGWAA